MFLNELGPQLNPVVLMPELLHLLTSLLALYLLVYGLACLLVHLYYLWADDLIDLIGRHLIYQVPQLHVRLLRVPRVLVCDGAFSGHLLKELRFCVREISDVLDLRLIHRLIALECQLFKVTKESFIQSHARSFSCPADPETASADPDSSNVSSKSSLATPCA